VAAAAAAAPAVTVNTGNTAFMMICAALVLLMTLPGLALFYGGLVRKKNILSVLMHCLAAAAIVSVVWAVYGFSFAFGEGNAFFGNTNHLFLANTDGFNSLFIADANGVPAIVFVMFQMTFAIITPALIAGGFAERMRFPAFCLFTLLWVSLIYCPICHWVWGAKGFLYHGNADAWAKALDFAGGTVVHINAGIAALVCALYLGKRKGFPNRLSPPHNLPFAIIGACLLWIGWFGFNAGSELACDQTAANAMLYTQVAAAVAALVWLVLDGIYHGKATALGAITGAVAGLVAITPACGFVDLKGSLFIGILGAAAAWAFVVYLKPKLKLDDTLDAFGVHGVAGIVGALLTGVFCVATKDGMSHFGQFVEQLKAVAVTIGFSALGTWILLMLVNCITKVRADEREETVGLDVSQHKESAYTVID
jgi:Amt family ammonium transporter